VLRRRPDRRARGPRRARSRHLTPRGRRGRQGNHNDQFCRRTGTQLIHRYHDRRPGPARFTPATQGCEIPCACRRRPVGRAGGHRPRLPARATAPVRTATRAPHGPADSP
jgi:hypothetical protein